MTVGDLEGVRNSLPVDLCMTSAQVQTWCRGLWSDRFEIELLDNSVEEFGVGRVGGHLGLRDQRGRQTRL